MTQRPDDTRLHDWLDETVGPTPDPDEGTHQVMSQIEETSQVGRWLPFPVLHRKAKANLPTTNDSSDYQPTPIPSANGHSPTVLGRTQSMLSPVKAITAGALIFALGGMFLIAQPFDQQGAGAPGAATDAEREAPMEFSGRLLLGQPIKELFDETVDGVIVGRTAVYGPLRVVTMSDSRLDGEATISTELRVFGGEDGIEVFNKVFRIENDAGAWQEVPGFVLGSSQAWTSTFIGEGDYAGLFAIADVLRDTNGWDLHGYIIDGEFPPAPEPYVTE